MRHPYPQNPASSANPGSTRRLRIALGTWVAIEARFGLAETARPDGADTDATTSGEPPPPALEMAARGGPTLPSLVEATDRPRFTHPTAPGSESREASQHAAIEAAYAAIHDIDIRMHPHREGSEIARINSAEPGTPIELQPDTWRLRCNSRVVSSDLTDGSSTLACPPAPAA